GLPERRGPHYQRVLGARRLAHADQLSLLRSQRWRQDADAHHRRRTGPARHHRKQHRPRRHRDPYKQEPRRTPRTEEGVALRDSPRQDRAARRCRIHGRLPGLRRFRLLHWKHILRGRWHDPPGREPV
ncbi:MAG: Glucose 1-dehydrogenase, partial [uncultured Rubrobacteraceae bacterium]